MSAPLLAVRDLSLWYGRAQVLFGLSFTVAEGEMVVLSGRNGAGKTSTLRAIMGLARTVRGAIEFESTPILGLPPHAIARLGVGYVPEDRRIFTELTVAENLEAGRKAPASGSRLRPWTRERVLELFPKLTELLDRPGSALSGGEQQMLTLARTLMGNPRLLLLDEPSEGLAPLVVERIAETVRELKREGLTILLSEQNERFTRAVADRV
ncbi:MAG: ABC transporter ATP-binding protein, partial [Casimicrobiaceae bacterium]|nr:ABC transporter ATP-binding protein [Casimicrobiaceae bacterium]